MIEVQKLIDRHFLWDQLGMIFFMKILHEFVVEVIESQRRSANECLFNQLILCVNLFPNFPFITIYKFNSQGIFLLTLRVRYFSRRISFLLTSYKLLKNYFLFCKKIWLCNRYTNIVYLFKSNNKTEQNNINDRET